MLCQCTGYGLWATVDLFSQLAQLGQANTKAFQSSGILELGPVYSGFDKLPRSKLSRLGSPPTSWERGILFS
jgi:hypothetical protein